jgi:hypothetical protein
VKRARHFNSKSYKRIISKLNIRTLPETKTPYLSILKTKSLSIAKQLKANIYFINPFNPIGVI